MLARQPKLGALVALALMGQGEPTGDDPVDQHTDSSAVAVMSTSERWRW